MQEGPVLQGRDRARDVSTTPFDLPEDTPPEDLLPDKVSTKLQELAEHFCTQIENEYQKQSGRREKWRKWLDYYRAQPKVEHKTFPWEGASNIVIGLIPIQVDQIVARIMQAIFSNDPHWTAKQLNRKLSGVTKPLEGWLDWLRQHSWDQYKVVKQALLECAKIGTAFIYNGWEDTPIFRWDEQNKQTEEVGRRRGPCPGWVPREDLLVPDGYIDEQTAPWIARRWWFSKQQYMEFVSAGFFEEHQEILDHKGDQDDRLRREKDDSLPSQDNPEDALLAIWLIHFNRDLDEDGFPEPYELWVHPDTHKSLRSGTNRLLYGMRPYVKLVFIELEGELDGMGVSEMIYQNQEEASTIHNQKRDNATIGNIKTVITRRGNGLAHDMKLKPGGIIFVTDPKDVIPFSLGEVNPSATLDEQSTIQFAQQRVGTNDVNMGNITPAIGRATASTVLSQIQEGTRRFDLNTSEIRRALSKQANQIIELFQTYGLPEPEDPNSPEMVLDPEDAAKVRDLLTNEDRIEGVVALQLNVSTAAVNKEIEKQSTQQLMGTMMQMYYLPVMQLMPQLMQMPPPLMAVGIKIIEGLDLLMKNVLQAHQRFDLESALVGELLPMIFGGGQDGTTPGAPGPQEVPGGAQGALPGGGPVQLQ